MNYSELTDFQINLAAAHIVLGVDGYDWSTEKQEVYIAGMDGGEFLPHAHFNPCNSWADAGAIILANKITISAPMEYDQPADWLAYPASDSDICVSHPNPLRAAMTAFLVMQEGK